MRPGLGRNVTLCLLVESCRLPQRLRHPGFGLSPALCHLRQVTGFDSVEYPDTSQAVCLEFSKNRHALRSLCFGAPRCSPIIQGGPGCDDRTRELKRKPWRTDRLEHQNASGVHQRRRGPDRHSGRSGNKTVPSHRKRTRKLLLLPLRIALFERANTRLPGGKFVSPKSLDAVDVAHDGAILAGIRVCSCLAFGCQIADLEPWFGSDAGGT